MNDNEQVTALRMKLQRLADEAARYVPNLSEAAPDQRRRLVEQALQEVSRLIEEKDSGGHGKR